jgi:hypothetical protein
VAEIEEQRKHIIIVKGEELDIIEANEYGVNKKIKNKKSKKIKIKIKKK